MSDLVGLDPRKPVLDKDSFAALIASIAGLSPGSVIWKTDPEPFVSDQDRARITLDLFSMTGLGWEERRRVYGLAGYPSNALVTVLLGNRTLIITMRAEAFDKSVEAAELIDTIRSSMIADGTIDALNALNLAYVTSAPAVRVDYAIDTRVVNCAIADFTFAGIAQHVASITTTGDWIETVNTNNVVTGDLSL